VSAPLRVARHVARAPVADAMQISLLPAGDEPVNVVLGG
jgi:hypothetical protein